MKNWHVLIVEDDPPSGDLLAYMLRYYEIEADTVTTAEKALDQLAAKDYNAAIIDLALPGMDGWALLKAIRENPRLADLQCVAVTAYHDAKVAYEAVQAGFLACFPKPLYPSFVYNLKEVLSA